MSIIIDVNTFPAVFDGSCQNHDNFKHVLEWIKSDRTDACIVYGGTKYLCELKKLSRYYRVIKILNDQGKVAKIDCKMIDDYEKILIDNHHSCTFNDQHLISIVSVSNCRLICSKDSSSYVHLKNQKFYPKGIKKPKIYTGSRNRDLLCSKNIVRLRNVIN